MDGVTPNQSNWHSPRLVMMFVGMLLLAVVLIVSILRDRIVNQPQWQVSVTGQGKVAYQPDIAVLTLGVQVDRYALAESALRTLNERVAKVVAAVKESGVATDDIQTQAYSLTPQYNYVEGVTYAAGYSANQQLTVKVSKLNENTELLPKVIGAATKAGANQVTSLTFDLSNLNDVKQEARLKAIEDAKSKAGSLAEAVGVKLGDVVGWWENVVQAPGGPIVMFDGKGGGPGAATPTVPTGLQEVVVEVNLNYKIK